MEWKVANQFFNFIKYFAAVVSPDSTLQQVITAQKFEN
jgi:hypothetical protein